jgi:hypothetical protein
MGSQSLSQQTAIHARHKTHSWMPAAVMCCGTASPSSRLESSHQCVHIFYKHSTSVTLVPLFCVNFSTSLAPRAARTKRHSPRRLTTQRTPSHPAVAPHRIDSIPPRTTGPLGALLIVRSKKRKSLVEKVCTGLLPIVCNPNIHGQSRGPVHASLCITLAVAVSSPPFSVHLTS